MKKYLFSIILLLFLIIPFRISALETVRLYLFHSTTCPHCQEAKTHINKMENKYDNLEVFMYEVSEFGTANLLNKVFEKLDYSTNSVPFIVIGSQYFSGFNTNIGYNLEDAVKYYSKTKHKDVVGEVLGIVPEFEGEENSNELPSNFKINLFGKEIDLKLLSLPVVSVLLGFVDGFNPCAMWVLLFLITMLIGMKNRKKMWILGIIFLSTSAIVYLLFMVAWLNISLKMQQVELLRMIIAFIALVAGAINLKNYFKMNDSGCNIVEDNKRKKILTYIKKITSQKYFILAILGIMVLAFIVNLIELACSAGLPLLFTQLLAINNLPAFMYGLNIFIYILFFLLDDLIIFIIAMITFKVTGISTKYTKYSHLIGGIIMIIIATLMIFKPEWLMLNF